jgi:ATP-grasp domain
VIRSLPFTLALPLLLLTGMTGMTACGSSGAKAADSAQTAVPVPFATVVQISVPGQSGKQQQAVVRDADAWRTTWAELRKDSALAEQPPAVDFDREMVVLAAMETQGCVSRVTIRSITRKDENAVVDVLEEPPAANCRCIVSARPIHAVRVQKIPGDVSFTTAKGEMACGAQPV